MSTGTPMRGGITYPDSIGGGVEESTIDRSSAFDGVLRTARNLRVEGQAKGEVYCDGTLFIEEGGQVDARVVSANISVAGIMTGEVLCHGKLEILPTGRVSGRVATASLVIQEGAIYEGELRMSNLDEEPTSLETQPMVRQVTSGADARTEVPTDDPDPKGGY
jgi:cytoskeletal protein CcmA (bactofilin family)